MFAPFVPNPRYNQELEKLRDQRDDLYTQIDHLHVENERLKIQLVQQAAQRVVVIKQPVPVQPAQSSRRSWTAEEYQLGVKMFIEGASWSVVSRRLGLKEGEVKGMFINRAPHEELLAEPIYVHSSGPMSIMELWKIGHGLYFEGWRHQIEARYHLPKESILWHTPVVVLTETAIGELRAEWQRSKGAKNERAYQVFSRIAQTYDPSQGSIPWIDVFNKMRKEVGLQTDLGPSFAARYNLQNNVTLFRVRETTEPLTAATVNDVQKLMPLTPQLQAHVDNLQPPPMRSHLPVYVGILRAGPPGISIRQLEIVGWGQHIGMSFHQMGRAPIDLERQNLIRKIEGDDKSAMLIAKYWDYIEHPTVSQG
jgi:hypothetical protein